MKDYQVYLFDMDGTLVNSEPLKGQALSLACADYGADVDSIIYKHVMGENWQVVTNHFFANAGISPNVVEFNQRFRMHYERLLGDRVELIAGARCYIQHLKRNGKKCGLVSSAATWMVDNILAVLQLDNCFDCIITQEHVSQHKPHPEAYKLALTQFTVAAENTLIFEDSYAGVTAGLASGCDVIAVKHEFNGGNDLSGAIAEISTFDELLK